MVRKLIDPAIVADIAAAIHEKGGTTTKVNALGNSIRALPGGGSQGWTRPAEWCDCDAVYVQYGSRKNCLVMGFDNSGRISNNRTSIKISGSAYSVMLHDANGVAQWENPQTFTSGSVCNVDLPAELEYGSLVFYTASATDNITKAELQAATLADGRKFAAVYQPIVELVGHQGTLATGMNCRFLVREKRKADLCTSLQAMWNNCYDLESLEFDGIDTSGWAVTSMYSTWGSCLSLRSLDVSAWNTTGWSVSSLGNTWFNCRSLESLDLSGWDTTNWQVATMASAWNNCNALRTLDVTDWNTTNWPITNAQSAWSYCYCLESLDLSGWDTAGWPMGNIYGAWSACTRIRTLNLSGWNTTGWTATNLSAFNGMTNLADFDFSGMDIFARANVVLSDSQGYSVEAIVRFFNGLPTASGTRTITLGSVNLNKLTAEEKAIATDKGYTLA